MKKDSDVKLVVAVLAGNCERSIDLCLKSVWDVADKIVVVYDTSSRDRTWSRLCEWVGKDFTNKLLIERREYEHDLKVKNANSRARNFYLDILKRDCMGWWAIVIDADECADDNIKELKGKLGELDSGKQYLLSPKMEHFIGNLGHVDATCEEHYVINRLFTVSNNLRYPEGEHPVLNPVKLTEDVVTGNFKCLLLWHFAYAREMWYVKDRYLTHVSKSEMHTPEYLQDWFGAHLTGKYPVREVDLCSLPKIVKDEFLIGDYFYFKNRGIEVKNSIMVHQWRLFFNPQSVLDLGCGRGPYVFYWDWICPKVKGVELSEWAVKHSFSKNVVQGDVLSWESKEQYDLITAVDLLEHISPENIGKAIENVLKHSSQWVLVSVPWTGNPDLYKDSTHRIFWSKEQWEQALLASGEFDLVEVPKNFLYSGQLLILKRKEERK